MILSQDNLSGGTFASHVKSISADGSIIVGYGTSASGLETFRWTAQSGMVGLGDLPGGSVESDPFDISADGSVIVGAGNSASGTETFIWTAKGGMQNLRELLIAGGATGLAGSWVNTRADAV